MITRRLLSGLLAFIMIASMFTVIPFTAAAEGETVVTWSGNTLDSANSMYDKEAQRRTGACTVSNMTVNYKGGKENADSGFYNDISTSVITKVIYLNNPDSELIFTSSYNNRYITKIEIEFDYYYSRGGGTSDTTNDHIVVNHGAWTNEDVVGSNGKHTLTMEGNAARSVTIRKNSDSYTYGIWKITSVKFYLTENLWTSLPNVFFCERAGGQLAEGSRQDCADRHRDRIR